MGGVGRFKSCCERGAVASYCDVERFSGVI